MHRRAVVLFGDLVGAKRAQGIVQDDGREYLWRHVVEPVVVQRRVGLEDGDALDGVANRRVLPLHDVVIVRVVVDLVASLDLPRETFDLGDAIVPGIGLLRPDVAAVYRRRP